MGRERGAGVRGSVAAAAARWRAAFVALFVPLSAAKLWLACTLPPFGDEAFYWQESRHPAWGYSDLPPLTAWLVRLGEATAGHGAFGTRWPFLLLDALGLVVFTIIGCNVALEMGQSPVIVIVSGLLTGIVGGVLRDVLCNDVPLVFSSDLYATVAIVSGGLYYLGEQTALPHDLVVLGTLVIGFSFRVAAIVWKIEMPKFVYDKDLR